MVLGCPQWGYSTKAATAGQFGVLHMCYNLEWEDTVMSNGNNGKPPPCHRILLRRAVSLSKPGLKEWYGNSYTNKYHLKGG